MERFLALLRLLSRRRRGRRYRADDDYQEGYEDVYYYTSKYSTHLLSESEKQWEQLISTFVRGSAQCLCLKCCIIDEGRSVTELRSFCKCEDVLHSLTATHSAGRGGK